MFETAKDIWIFVGVCQNLDGKPVLWSRNFERSFSISMKTLVKGRKVVKICQLSDRKHREKNQIKGNERRFRKEQSFFRRTKRKMKHDD